MTHRVLFNRPGSPWPSHRDFWAAEPARFYAEVARAAGCQRVEVVTVEEAA